jgi:hypothetical protein
VPVAKGGPPPLRQALLVGLGVVMTLGTILFFVTSTGNLLGGRPSIGLDAGEPVFRPGQAAKLADFIETQGEPLPFPDLAGGDRDIWLNHVGPDAETGWYAFGFRPQTAPRNCLAEWAAADGHFVDSCDGAIYPADGQGLPQFPVSVGGDGELSIRLDSITPSDGATTDRPVTSGDTGSDSTPPTTEGS